jgi:hypothetical protein
MFKNAIFIFAALLLVSCGKDPVPKPYGELRLEYPAPKYQKLKTTVPIHLNIQILQNYRCKKALLVLSELS